LAALSQFVQRNANHKQLRDQTRVRPLFSKLSSSSQCRLTPYSRPRPSASALTLHGALSLLRIRFKASRKFRLRNALSCQNSVTFLSIQTPRPSLSPSQISLTRKLTPDTSRRKAAPIKKTKKLPQPSPCFRTLVLLAFWDNPAYSESTLKGSGSVCR
jgi:hypothetical protein